MDRPAFHLGGEPLRLLAAARIAIGRARAIEADPLWAIVNLNSSGGEPDYCPFGNCYFNWRSLDPAIPLAKLPRAIVSPDEIEFAIDGKAVVVPRRCPPGCLPWLTPQNAAEFDRLEALIGEDRAHAVGCVVQVETLEAVIAWASYLAALGEETIRKIESPAAAGAVRPQRKAPSGSEWKALAVMHRAAVHPNTISSDELVKAMRPAGNAEGVKLTASRCKQLLAALVKKGWATMEGRRWCLSAEQRDAYRELVIPPSET
jgi:hypothetical protein